MNLATELTEWLNVFVLLGSLAAMVWTAVWSVNRIKNTTERLAMSLDHLKETVIRLDQRFEGVQGELILLRDRITKIETIVQINQENGNGRH